MDWIDRMVMKGVTKLGKEKDLSNPWARQTTRLSILYALSHSRKLGKDKLKEARYVFQKELDEYISNGTLEPQRLTWDPDGRESIPYHYSRLLALTVAVELASGKSSTMVAKAIREESTALCQSYFRWIDHIFEVWRGPYQKTGP